MQKLFRWSSKFLEAYAPGDIIVMAETAEQARELIRPAFEPKYLADHAWMYADKEDFFAGCDGDNRQSFEKARAVFEADIAVEPEELPGFIFISGSE